MTPGLGFRFRGFGGVGSDAGSLVAETAAVTLTCVCYSNALQSQDLM